MRTMRAFILGDLQAQERGLSVGPDGINERLNDLIKELERIRLIALKKKIGFVIIAGDIFDERGKLSVVVLSMFYRVLSKYRLSGIKVIIDVGNHDKVPVGNFHALEVFQDVAIVCDKPRIYDFNGARVLIIPFLSEPRKTKKILRKHGKHADLIIMHTAVKGIKMSSGAIWSEGIRLKNIPKGRIVLMGHDHAHKKIRKNVWYLGSLQHVDRSDENKKKFFALWDSSKKKRIKWIKSRGPKYVSFDYNSYSRLKDLTEKEVENNFVRILYDGPIERIGEIKKRILKLGARSVEIPPVITSTISDNQNIRSGRIAKMMWKRVKELPQQDRIPTLKLGQDILTEAMHESDI